MTTIRKLMAEDRIRKEVCETGIGHDLEQAKLVEQGYPLQQWLERKCKRCKTIIAICRWGY